MGWNLLFPYLDDVLIASFCKEEHCSHLKTVFKRLGKYGLRINIIKTILEVSKTDFLGYQISAKESKLLPEKIKAIEEYPLPKTIHELC